MNTKLKFCEYCRGVHIGKCDKAVAAHTAAQTTRIVGMSDTSMDWLLSLTFTPNPCPLADKKQDSVYDDDSEGGGMMLKV